MGKPTFETSFLIPIFLNVHEWSKRYYYNERSRNLHILNMEIAEKTSICKLNNKFSYPVFQHLRSWPTDVSSIRNDFIFFFRGLRSGKRKGTSLKPVVNRASSWNCGRY